MSEIRIIDAKPDMNNKLTKRMVDIMIEKGREAKSKETEDKKINTVK